MWVPVITFIIVHSFFVFKKLLKSSLKAVAKKVTWIRNSVAQFCSSMTMPYAQSRLQKDMFVKIGVEELAWEHIVLTSTLINTFGVNCNADCAPWLLAQHIVAECAEMSTSRHFFHHKSSENNKKFCFLLFKKIDQWSSKYNENKSVNFTHWII